MAQFPELNGKVVIVTGGANGIGEATVRTFHAQGAQVFFCDKDIARGEQLAREMGNNCSFQAVDLADETSLVDWIKSIKSQAQKIHALVNNAARDPRIPFLQTSTQQWEDLFALNVRAGFLLARECAPSMPPGAAIVNVTSVVLYNSPKNLVAYVSTKGAMLGFTRCLARELGERRIRVNCVSPGWVFTERQKKDYINDEALRLIHEHQCIPDHLQPDEIARVILFLASDMSAAVTGQEILADRGWAHS